MLTLTKGSDSIVVLVRTDLAVSRESKNIEHDVIDSTVQAISVRQSGVRKGQLELLVADVDDALLAEQIISSPGPCTYTDSVNAHWSMAFVLSDGGSVTRTLDQDTRVRWTVAADFTEVTA